MSKTSKTILWLIVAIIVIGGIWYGVSRKPTEKETVKIGVMLPLTGFLANPGQDTKSAIEMAFNDLSVKNDVELIFEDEKCDAMQTLTVYRKLVNIDKVNFIVGPFCGQSAMAILDSLNKDEVIAISPGAPDNELSKERDYFYRTRIPNRAEVQKLVEFLINKNITRVAVYTAKNTFGKSYRDSFMDQFGAKGGNIVFDDGSMDYQTDFKTDILKIKETNPEALFLVPASRQQMGIFIKQLKELGINILVLGGSVTEQQDLLDSAGTAADGVIYPYVIPKNMNVVNEYKEKYSKNPSMEVLNGYDAFNILYTELKECNFEKSCVKQNLDSLKNFNGVMGTINFDKFGDPEVKLILKTVKNGQFVPYGE